MDFSDYPKHHDNYDNTNKKVLGKFKDEVNDKIIREWISLVPKMYAGDIQDCKEKKQQKVSQNKSLNVNLHLRNTKKR